jgi:glycerophosphoryl diester phosphodiesterase
VPVRPTTLPARLLSAALALAASIVITPALAAAPATAATADCVAPPVAHRGASGAAPENTIPAYRAALRAGVTRLDLDVRFTRSGVPVVMHDSTVDRTTDGTGRVSGMSLAELRSLDAGSWFAPEFTGVKVPTLRQALSFGRARGASFQLELKGRPTTQQLDNFLNRVRELDMLSQVRVITFDEATIGQVRAMEPGAATGIIDFSGEPRPAAAVLQYGTSYVIGFWSVTETRAAQWRAAGIEIRPWTVNTVKGWERMAYDDAGPVITDRPLRYLSWARSFCS